MDKLDLLAWIWLSIVFTAIAILAFLVIAKMFIENTTLMLLVTAIFVVMFLTSLAAQRLRLFHDW